MTVYLDKARGKWRYDFRLRGERHAGYCIDPADRTEARNKTEAKRVEQHIKVRLDQAKPEPTHSQSPSIYTISEAFAAYALQKEGTRNWENVRGYVRDLLTWFGPFTDVRDVTTQRVWEYIAWARQQPVMVYVGGNRKKADLLAHRTDPATLWRPAPDDRRRSDSTINRYLVALRETLAIAHEIKDHEGRPKVLASLPKVPDLAEPEILPRPIADDLLWEMVDRSPPHLAWGLLLARLMGFRQGEMFGIRCQQVDLQNGGVWLPAADTKANRDEFVPASDDALELLEYLLAEAKARRTDYLITYRRRLKSGTGEPIKFSPPRPIKRPKSAWERVLREMGLTGVHRFHNTKASFVTAVGMAASSATTQKLARHRDHRTTERYLLVSDQAARAAVNAAGLKVSSSTQGVPHRGKKKKGSADVLSANPLSERSFSMVGQAGFEPTTPSPPD